MLLREKERRHPWAESDAFCSAFMDLGNGWEVPDGILPDVEKFVCALYGQKDSAGAKYLF